jgi:hypothetical protein
MTSGITVLLLLLKLLLSYYVGLRVATRYVRDFLMSNVPHLNNSLILGVSVLPNIVSKDLHVFEIKTVSFSHIL